MAKRSRVSKASASSFLKKDFAGWNFVIFLTLAFMLLVAILASMKGVAMDIRSKAGLTCRSPFAAFNNQMPRAAECNGQWSLLEDERGCQSFACVPNPRTSTTIRPSIEVPPPRFNNKN